MFSYTNNAFRLALGLTVLTGLGMASSAQADVIIFDDADGAGWSRPWYSPAQTTNVYSGTHAVSTGNGQLAFNHTGLVDTNHILEFYANTTDETPTSDLFIRLNWTDADSTEHANISFDDRNVPVVYLIDGVAVNAGTSQNGIALDTDTSTWQKIQLDLTQTAYTSFDPYIPHNYVPGSGTLTSITFRNDGGQSSNVVMDDVRLVPEPGSMALLGVGAACLLARRRRTQTIG